MTGLYAWAQPSWKDSVGVKKVLNARYADGVIYYQVKKGWGVYDRVAKKTVVPPQYQFIKRLGDSYYIVQNNRVGMLNSEGKVAVAPVYTRVGQIKMDGISVDIRNNRLYYRNTVESMMEYNMADIFTEQSVAVYNGKVFVNDYIQPELRYYQIGTPDGLVLDSIDANGAPVPVIEEPLNGSGIYLLADHSEVPGFTGMSKVGFCKNTLLAFKRQLKEKEVLPTWYIQDARTGKIHTITDPNAMYLDKKNLELILSDYNTRFIHRTDSTEKGWVMFESAEKYGIYDSDHMVVSVEPVYDFVYPTVKHDKIYTVKNGKVGMIDNNGNLLYDNIYESLETHMLDYAEYFYDMVICNDWGYEPYPTIGDSVVVPHRDIVEARINHLHEFTGLRVVNGKVVVHDYMPPVETMDYWNPDFPEQEPMMTTFPDKGYGGVFDPAARKWIIKPKYSLITTSNQGYACKQTCEQPAVPGCFTYSFFGPDGRAVFENKHIDSVWKNEAWLTGLAHAGPGKTSVKQVKSTSGEYVAIVSCNNKYGVFDLPSLRWKVDPVHDMIDHNALSGYYTVVDSGRMGMINYDYQLLVPSLYHKLDLFPIDNLICANDTFLYSTDSMYLAGKVDSLKDLIYHYYRQYPLENLFLSVTLAEKKLIASEEWYNPEYEFILPDGEISFLLVDSSGTHITDLVSGTRLDLVKGWNPREWDKGFVTVDAGRVWHVWDQGGKKLLSLSGKDSIGCTGQWLVWAGNDEQYVYSPGGEIVVATPEDRLYLDKTYAPVGYSYHYFDGNKFIEGPKDFRVMCVNDQGLLLGYEIQTDANTGKKVKRYRYYDTGSRQYSDPELELSPSAIKVFAVKDAFVLFDYNTTEGLYTCIVLEKDLKTVKSTFKKLTGYKTAGAYGGIYPIPYYELYTDKKIMYFDRDFQFLHECNNHDRLNLELGYNKLILRSKFKTLVMDWKGRLIRQ